MTTRRDRLGARVHVADRLSLQRGDAPSLSSLLATGGAYDLDVDVMRNTVVVHIEHPEVFASAFADLYGPEMLVVEGGPASLECGIDDCRYTLKGGLRIEGCSSGFSAIQNGGGYYYLLSAAHCGGSNVNDIGQWRTHAGEAYGYVSYQVEQGCVDAEAHYRPWPSSWFMSGTVLVDSTQSRSMYYHIYWQDTPVGPDAWVGLAGANSGTSRGKISSKHYSPSYAPECGQFLKASYCSEPGDSGGSNFNTNTAYGIHSGGLSAYTCDYNPYGLDYGIFGNIVFATDALGVGVLAGP